MNFKSLSKKQLILLIQLILAKMKPKKPKKDYEAFRLAMGKSESSNNYYIVNSLGYMGCYQFGMARLCDLGYTTRIKQGWSNDCFKWKDDYEFMFFHNGKEFQDKVFKEHIVSLLKYIDKNFKKYFGTHKNGVLITRSGCAGFAHLAGLGGLKKFLTTGFDPKDVVSGTPATAYMKKFNNYDLTKVA